MASGLARLMDPVFCGSDAHGFPPWVMTFPVTGCFISGSTNVFCNSRPAIRQGDSGIHVACPGPNSFTATIGSPTVLINSRMAMRGGDVTTHCGLSPGNVLQGLTSSNTIVGP